MRHFVHLPKKKSTTVSVNFICLCLFAVWFCCFISQSTDELIQFVGGTLDKCFFGKVTHTHFSQKIHVVVCHTRWQTMAEHVQGRLSLPLHLSFCFLEFVEPFDRIKAWHLVTYSRCGIMEDFMHVSSLKTAYLALVTPTWNVGACQNLKTPVVASFFLFWVNLHYD